MDQPIINYTDADYAEAQAMLQKQCASGEMAKAMEEMERNAKLIEEGKLPEPA